jgi:NAD(P)-dependent dehydrogenase (short-subunit alcohol dehydrogenase family)
MTTESNIDPTSKYGSDPGAEQQHKQVPPGSTEEMVQQVDHGEASYQGSGKLAGRKAIITGGDSGIGRAVAIAFAREGADVLISYLNEDNDAEKTAGFVRDAGGKAILVPGDISEEAHCRKLIETAVAEFGRIDILVNNAAFQMSRGSLQEVSSEEWDKTFKTNIYPMFFLCKMAEPYMQPGSTVINTTSVNAYKPKPTLVAYAATKAAIQNFTSNIASFGAKKESG